jgi:hypothetical protein
MAFRGCSLGSALQLGADTQREQLASERHSAMLGGDL